MNNDIVTAKLKIRELQILCEGVSFEWDKNNPWVNRDGGGKFTKSNKEKDVPGKDSINLDFEEDLKNKNVFKVAKNVLQKSKISNNKLLEERGKIENIIRDIKTGNTWEHWKEKASNIVSNNASTIGEVAAAAAVLGSILFVLNKKNPDYFKKTVDKLAKRLGKSRKKVNTGTVFDKDSFTIADASEDIARATGLKKIKAINNSIFREYDQLEDYEKGLIEYERSFGIEKKLKECRDMAKAHFPDREMFSSVPNTKEELVVLLREILEKLHEKKLINDPDSGIASMWKSQIQTLWILSKGEK